MVDVLTNTAPVSAPKPISVNLAELDKLAKLLATENISVEHKQVETAYFDTERRQLILPMWQDLTKELYHMLVLHEIGHALYTTPEDWKSAVISDKTIKNALNVVEDARIERLVKQRYPGSRRDFREGYKLLAERDFFQLKGQEIRRMHLGDRINLHYKIGDFTPVPFSNFEKIFIRAIDDVKTFEEALWVAKELSKYVTGNQLSEEFKAKYGKTSPGDEDEDEDFGDEEADWGEGEEGDEFGDSDWGDADESEDELDSAWSDASNDEDEDEGEVAEESDDGTPTSGNGKSKSKDDKEPGQASNGEGSLGGSTGWHNESTAERDFQTVESLEKSLQGMRSKAAPTIPYEMVDDLDYKKWVVGYKDILTSIRATWPESIQGDEYAKMRRRNIKVVDYLAKEFFLRKAADGYQRVRESKTGILNPDKLHGYKIIDDVFRRNTVLAESKNHGIVMYIDFSGSMSNVLGRTIEQLINLVLFCRKVNIPHRVYAFTDNNWSFVQNYLEVSEAAKRGIPIARHWGVQASYRRVVDPVEIKRIVDSREGYLKSKYSGLSGEHVCVPDPEMNLLELFHEKMSARDVSNMAEAMLYCFPLKYDYHTMHSVEREERKPQMFALGGTPLDATVMLSAAMLKAFKRETNSQIVSAVYLTDGESGGFRTLSDAMRQTFVKDPKHPSGGTYQNVRAPGRVMKTWSVNVVNTIFRNAKNKRVFVPQRGGHYGMNSTATMMKWISDLGFHTVGYRIMSQYEFRNTARYSWPMQQSEQLSKEFKANKCVSIPDSFGYNLFNAIMMDSISVDEEEDFKFDVKEGATKNQIAKAFIKARTDRLNMRIVLQNFIKTIAA